MENLVKEEKMRFELLQILNYDADKAKECYNFIKGECTTSGSLSTNSTELQDGIYIMQKGSAPILFKNQTLAKEQKILCSGIGVKYGNKSLVISLYDMTDSNRPLTACDGGVNFATTLLDAVSDINGRQNTEIMRTILYKSIVLMDGEYIPSLGEWLFILPYIKDINKALLAVGGTEIQPEVYYTSTQYSAADAWAVALLTGQIEPVIKTQDIAKTRTVSSFLL